jgi:hypothetical protein
MKIYFTSIKKRGGTSKLCNMVRETETLYTCPNISTRTLQKDPRDGKMLENSVDATTENGDFRARYFWAQKTVTS